MLHTRPTGTALTNRVLVARPSMNSLLLVAVCAAGCGSMDTPEPGTFKTDDELSPVSSACGSTVLAVAAEGQIVSPMTLGSDAGTSTGQYVTTTVTNLRKSPPPPAGTGSDNLEISVPAAGKYFLWSRVRYQSDTSDSFWVQVDGNASAAVVVGNEAAAAAPYGTWHWVDWPDGGYGRKTPISFTLSAGEHRISLIGRERRTQIDGIVLSTDPSFTPSGTLGSWCPHSDGGLEADGSGGDSSLGADGSGGDSGSSCSPACTNGERCSANTDCISGACTSGTCQALPLTSWSANLGTNPHVVTNVPEPQFPDGVMPVFKGLDGNWIAIWSESRNYRSEAASPYFEDQPKPTEEPLGLTNGIDDPNFTGTFGEAGMWLVSVFRSPIDQNKLIGILHCEMNRPGGGQPTYKSLARVVSTDEGHTWTDPRQIAVYGPNVIGQWGGIGDASACYDPVRKEYRAYAFARYGANGVMLLRSTDPEAAPGTWEYYNNGWVGVSALTGTQASPVSGLEAAGNPAVTYNTFLDRWMIVSWPWGATYITFAISTDGITWQSKRYNLTPTPQGSPWYPFLVGEGGTRSVGQTARLYWNDWAGGRHMQAVNVTFSRSP